MPKKHGKVGVQMVTESPVLTVEEAAKLCRISRASAYEACRRGELPCLRIGRRLLISRARLLALLGQGGGQTSAGDDGNGRAA
jgi:excisionase family DNA binding protein